MLIKYAEQHWEVDGEWKTVFYPVKRYYHPSIGYYYEVVRREDMPLWKTNRCFKFEELI